jgi:transposase
MLLKTILNRIAPQKSFVYGKVTLVSKEKAFALEVEIQPRRNSRAVCSGCHRKQPGYDRLPIRRFELGACKSFCVSVGGNEVCEGQ